MNTQYLTLKNLILGAVGSTLESVLNKNKNDARSSRYDSIIKTQGNGSSNTILKRKRGNGSFIFVKSVTFKFKTLAYYQLVNEVAMLRLISKYTKSSNISTPKIINVTSEKNQLSLSIENITAKKLAEYNSSTQLKVVGKVIEKLSNITQSINQETLNLLPRRTNVFIYISFIFYFVCAVTKNPSKISLYARFLFVFYKFFTPAILRESSYVLSHRDLDPENILYEKSKIYILDPEVMALSHSLTEVATVTRYYFQFLSVKQIHALIGNFVKTKNEKEEFIALTIFFSMQMLSIEKKGSRFYQQAEDYLEYFRENVMTKLLPEKREFGEVAYNWVLQLSSFTNLLLKPFGTTNKPLIICYHSVENDLWKFSTPVEEFKKQILFLRNNFQIVSLKNLLNDPSENKVAITFDDGYKNTIKNAVPVLKKYKIPATFFVLGQPENANRKELENMKNLINTNDLKNLYEYGFDVGFHTNTHGNLHEMTDAQLENEIAYGKKTLEKKLGQKVNYFAYPRGLYSSRITKFVKKAGFKAGFTINNGPLDLSNKFLIPRYSVNGDLSFADFKTSVTPVGLYMGQKYMDILRLKDNVSRAMTKPKLALLK